MIAEIQLIINGFERFPYLFLYKSMLTDNNLSRIKDKKVIREKRREFIIVDFILGCFSTLHVLSLFSVATDMFFYFKIKENFSRILI